MLVIATASDSIFGFYHDLKRQVAKRGIFMHYEEIKPFSWAAMLEWELEYASMHHKDIVCFVDSNDFLFQGNANDISNALGGSDLLFHSEAICWPEPHKADQYPESPTPFRFVNGTGPCGYGDSIAEAISYGMKNFPVRGRESSIFADNDQRFFTDVFLAGFGRVDYHSQLSLSLNAVEPTDFTISNGKLRLTSGVEPAFIHANGASKYRYAKELDRLR